MCDWLLVIHMPGNTVGQMLFSVAVQQLEFHHRMAKTCHRQADNGFFALTLLILGKTSGICYQKTMGSAPNDYNLRTDYELGCLTCCMGWLLAFAQCSSLNRWHNSHTDGSSRGVVITAGGRIHPRSRNACSAQHLNHVSRTSAPQSRTAAL